MQKITHSYSHIYNKIFCVIYQSTICNFFDKKYNFIILIEFVWYNFKIIPIFFHLYLLALQELKTHRKKHLYEIFF